MIGYQCITTVVHRYVEYCVKFVFPSWKNPPPKNKKKEKTHEKSQTTREDARKGNKSAPNNGAAILWKLIEL